MQFHLLALICAHLRFGLAPRVLGFVSGARPAGRWDAAGIAYAP